MSSYREVFKPEPAGDYQDPGKIFYTITAEDVGKAVIHTAAESISVGAIMTRVRDRDVGKRLYRVPTSDPHIWIWQLENDAQLRARTDEKRFGQGT